MENWPKVDVRQVALAFRVNQRPQRPLELGVLHGLTAGMYKSGNLFDFSSFLLTSGLIKRLAVVGGDGRTTGGIKPKKSWMGSGAVLKVLTAKGVNRGDILVTDPITNSKEEAAAIIKLARQFDFKWVGSISVAYHGGRMLPYMVKVMQETGYWFYYFMLPAPLTNWKLSMMSSQGRKKTNCFEAACEDAQKIEAHIEKGWAATFDEVIDYLDRRDNMSLSF